MSAAIVAAAVGAAFGGRLSDRYGRKRALLVADVLFAAGAAAMGLTPNAAVLILGEGLCPWIIPDFSAPILKVLIQLMTWYDAIPWASVSCFLPCITPMLAFDGGDQHLPPFDP